MDRVKKLHLRKALRQLGDRLANIGEAFAEILAAMPRDENQAPLVKKPIFPPPCRLPAALAFDGPQQCVDDGVAGHEHAVRGDVFRQQTIGRAARRRAVQAGRQRGRAAVHFLRPRRLQIAGAQPRLDVHERHAAVKGGQRRRQHRRGVSLGNHAIGPVALQSVVQSRQTTRRQLGERSGSAASAPGQRRPVCRSTPSPGRASPHAGR